MSNLFQKTINLGFGLFSYSREKIEELVDEMANRGEIAKSDSKNMVKELIKKGASEKEELKNLIREEFQNSFIFTNLPKKEDILTKDDIRALIREELEKMK